MSISLFLSKIVKFLKNLLPLDSASHQKEPWWKKLIFVYIYFFITNILIFSISKFIPDNFLTQGNTIYRMILQYLDSPITLIIFFTYICFFTPLVEETIFRLPLIDYGYFHLSLSLFFALEIGKTLFWLSNTLSEKLLVIILSLLSWLLIYSLLKKIIRADFLRTLWGKKRNIFYFSALIFALLHAPNYSWNYSNFYFFPLVMLPFFILGIAFAYSRIMLGFRYAVLFHMINNILAFYNMLSILK